MSAADDEVDDNEADEEEVEEEGEAGEAKDRVDENEDESGDERASEPAAVDDDTMGGSVRGPKPLLAATGCTIPPATSPPVTAALVAPIDAIACAAVTRNAASISPDAA